MGRISEDELSRLKSEVSLARLAEARGIRLKKSGDNLLGLCPFHDDREPSLVISREQKRVALPRSVPGGRVGDRLGDAGGESARFGWRSRCCARSILL